KFCCTARYRFAGWHGRGRGGLSFGTRIYFCRKYETKGKIHCGINSRVVMNMSLREGNGVSDEVILNTMRRLPWAKVPRPRNDIILRNDTLLFLLSCSMLFSCS